MTISNTMKIKQQDGSFKEVKISYMKSNGCAEEGKGTYASGSCTHAEGGNTNLMWKGGIYLTGVAGATSYTVTGIGASSIKKGDLITKSSQDTNRACVLEIEEDQIILDHTLSKTTDFNEEAFGVLEGFSKIVGNYSHGEGYQNVAFGNALHAEGYLNTITEGGLGSHIEGYRNTISGNGQSCHAEGSDNEITHSLGGYSSHIEGVYNTIADGEASLATASHVNGIGNECHGAAAQTIIGKYNEIDYGNDEKIYGNYSFIVGNGTRNGDRSNAHTLDWDGNAWFAGDVTTGENNVSLNLSNNEIWTNDFPERAFEKQNLTLTGKIAKYKFIYIFFNTTSDQDYTTHVVIPVSDSQTARQAFSLFNGASMENDESSGAIMSMNTRSVILNGETISFGEGRNKIVTEKSATVMNTVLIPTAIYGIL